MSSRHSSTVKTLHVLMERPKWWNEAFARYDQKKLKAWAEELHTKALQPQPQRLDDVPTTPTASREFYLPFVVEDRSPAPLKVSSL